MTTTKPREDTRPEQAVRVADFLEKNPASTLKEIDAVCDTGCITKVLSEMEKPDLLGMGYGIQRGRREVSCANGTRIRNVCTYTLVHRPAPVRDLFSPA